MNNRLRKTIQQILLAGTTATFAAGTLAALGQQNPPPVPGQVPDYFGVVPNYANSPQPVLTQVIIGDSNAQGSGATATATKDVSGAILQSNVTVGNPGSGYVNPSVTISDQATGHGASLSVVLAGSITDIVLDTTIPYPGCNVTPLIDLTSLTVDPTTAASANVIVDNTGAITGFNIANAGAGLSFANPPVGLTAGQVPITCDGSQVAIANVAIAPGNPGEISSITISNGGKDYSASAQVTISGAGTGATATVSKVDGSGVITELAFTPGGSGYTTGTTVSVVDVPTGQGATATAIVSTSNTKGNILGAITGITVTNGGTGYRSPQIAIKDQTAAGTGSGAVAVAAVYDYGKDVQTNTIMDVQVLSPGSGYNADTKVTITDGAGNVSATITPIISNGSIVGFGPRDQACAAALVPPATDQSCPIALANRGSGYKTPFVGTGIRKFVDALPGFPDSSYVGGNGYDATTKANDLGQSLAAAVPDTSTFPGSDYYIFAEQEHAQKLHFDLPATNLRGYVQLKPDGITPMGTIQYLGPIIIAHKNRPVRIKLVNQLTQPLTVPVDTTYMGADTPDVIDPATGASTDKRTAMHLHGGNTPWISDGTARQWVKPAGDVGPNKGESARNVPDMWFKPDGSLFTDNTGVAITNPDAAAIAANNLSNNPGDGALTFFYTNEQSARLMFYHDHAEGTTRLNVYAGMAGGYLLQDPTEQAMVIGGTAHAAALTMGYSAAEAAKFDSSTSYTAGTLPPLADTIPLVIQEKTFVPDDTQPVLNFYGPFKSQLNSQDPTWRWGSGTAAPALMGNGDLWVPHVFMPNQNPDDITGANAVGRWDYGPWFWPPFVNLQNGPLHNPYHDPNCNTTTSYCEPSQIPGVPNGSFDGVHDNSTGKQTSSPSGTPEAFNDTPLVNGTVYPYINVDPKKYRLRMLSVGNDRMLNLSLVIASSKNTDSSAAANSGATSQAAKDALCDGHTINAPLPEDCTEVRMVPWDASQDKLTQFPTWWYTKQKGGVTFDGRPSGVFDPAVRGPEMVQIGTEGGFLSSPVEIKNQPVNYEYNPKNILIGNVKEHALLLGPAERADVLVDFSNFAGSTLLLYNDNPAPMPAWDLRLDYYTGGFDNTDTGGAFSVVPGYGPNSRTLMQIRVSTNGGQTSPKPDDKGTIDLAALSTAVQTAFKTSQEPIIVPQSPYGAAYGLPFTDKPGIDLSRIADTKLSYTPIDAPTLTSTGIVKFGAPITLELEPKSIIEDWTQNWGRMNALLGIEIPRTTATTQTSIPQAFVDPQTELVKITPNDNMVPISGTAPDGTQIWKITHNGVDSHAVHFHLFHVQIVNRVGWDGAIYAPDTNELGWKDTVRMNPLSDTIVALRPMTMTALPFKVPNSHRLINPSVNASALDFFNLDPLSGNASNVSNLSVNYGWEYLWHCHILGHEENDMMRTISAAQPPEAPAVLAPTTVPTGVKLDWVDNSIISNWVTIYRSLDGLTNADGSFKTVDTTINVATTECTNQAGCAMTYTDTTAPAATSVWYQIVANNTVGAGDGKLDGPRDPVTGFYTTSLPPEVANSLTPGFTGYANVTANSNTSNIVSRLAIPTAKVTAGPLTFANQLVNTTSVAQTVTVQNTGTGTLAISGAALTTGTNFAISNNACPATLAPGAICNIGVTFKPTATGALSDTLTITDNSSTGTTQPVSLSGNGVAPVASLPATPLAFGSVNVGATSVGQTAILSNTGTAPLTINSIVASAPFAQTNDCGTSLAAPVAPATSTSCTITVTFKPTVPGVVTPNGTLTVTDNSNGGASTQTVNLSGTGLAVGPVVPAVPSVVRDNFNRANANILGAGWQQNALLGLSVLRVNATQATANLLGATGSAYSNTVGSATQGAGFTFANTTVNNTALYLKATGAIGGVSGQLQNEVRVLYNSGSVTIATTTNGNAIAPTYTAVGAAISTGGSLANGNSLLAAVDNTGKVWVWKVVGATTTLLTPAGVQLPNNALWTTGGGKVGMQLPNGARVDNFVAY